MSMFGERDEQENFGTGSTSGGSAGNFNTILDKAASFEGKMNFEGDVIINGRFKGEIFSDGNLVVGEDGNIEGTIEIGSIEIQGEVHGNISAKEKIEINAPAVVRGDISAPSLIIKEGAVFEGNCSMGQNAARNVVDLNPQQADSSSS